MHPSQVQQNNKLSFKWFKPQKGLKLVLIGLFVSAAFFALGYRVLNTISIKGVVNAPILFIQAPIDGTIVEDNLKAGETIQEGTLIYVIHNDRLDTSNLHYIQSQLQLAQANLVGLKEQIKGYQTSEVKLTERLEQHLAKNQLYLQSKTQEIEQLFAKAQRALEQTKRDQLRQERLVSTGVNSQQALENAQLSQVSAEKEVQAFQASIRRAKTEEDAGLSGILLDGYSGAPYARQRLDEVELKLTESFAELLREEQRILALTQQLASEQVLMDKRREATILAPSLVLVQSARASKGSYVTKGTVLCELIDCNKSYVEATIPEKEFDRVRIGDKADVYLYGNNSPIQGTVISMRGAGAFNASNPEQFAARVVKTTPDSMLVGVSINSADLLRIFGHPNQVGRTARVKIHKR